MKKILILLSPLFFAAFSVFGQKSALHNEILQAKESNIHFANAVLSEVSTDKNVLSHFINPDEVYFFDNISLDFKNNEIKALHVVLPIKNKNIILELVEAPKYFYDNMTTITYDGEIFPVSRDIKHYRGIVKDDFNTVVAITFCEDEMIGLICTEEGNFNLAKDSASGKHILYNGNNLKEQTYPVYAPPIDNNLVSYDPEVLFRERTVFSKDGKIITDPALNKWVNIYVETRYNIYIRHGSSVKNVEKNIFGMFNQVAALFLNEDIHIGSICLCIHRAIDPYSHSDSACIMLKEFQKETTSIMGADLGILLSYRGGSSGQYKGGCSVLDGLCKPTISEKLAAINLDKDYKEIPEYSTSIHLITHELGHLLGSLHTHACVWHNVYNCAPLDGCVWPGSLEEHECGPCMLTDPFLAYPPEGGTIMSYCHLPGRPGVKFIHGFGEQPGEVIRNSVRNADCLECITPKNITNQTITTNQNIIGCDNLNFQNVTITNGATVNITAGKNVTLKPNFHAVAGTTIKITVGSYYKGYDTSQSSMLLTNNETTPEELYLQSLVPNNIDFTNSSPNFKLYPNPNNGTFQIDASFPLTDIADFKVINLMGASIYETRHLASNTIQLGTSASGIVFIVMILKDGSFLTQKMTIQR